MLTYGRIDALEIIKYTNSDFVGCIDRRKSTFDHVYLLDREMIS